MIWLGYINSRHLRNSPVRQDGSQNDFTTTMSCPLFSFCLLVLALANREISAQSNFEYSGFSWPSSTITYNFKNYPSSALSTAETEAAFARAAAKWAAVTCLNFVQQDTTGGIEVQFATGEYGGIYTFTEGNLTYAYPPYPGELSDPGQGGDIDVNDDYTYIDGCSTDPSQVNLEQLFLAQIGESLGLLDSSVAGSVMADDYLSTCVADPQLSQDDIDGIQSIYNYCTTTAATTTTTAASTTTTAAPTTTTTAAATTTTTAATTTTTTAATTKSCKNPFARYIPIPKLPSSGSGHTHYYGSGTYSGSSRSGSRYGSGSHYGKNTYSKTGSYSGGSRSRSGCSRTSSGSSRTSSGSSRTSSGSSRTSSRSSRSGYSGSRSSRYRGSRSRY